MSSLNRSGLGEVCDLYDAYFIDAWGVLHDGSKPYPGVLDCLQQLSARGKHVVILSNSSRRKGSVLSGLRKLGFDTDLILDVVTSGDVAWEELHTPTQEPFKSLGRSCLVLGNGDDDVDYVKTAGLTLADAERCDFVLARGSFALTGATSKIQEHASILERPEVAAALDTARSRGVPLLVTNPDFLRPGTNDPMPGLIGRDFAAAGGAVHWVGKPYDLVYARCRAAAAAGGVEDARRVCGVGDSLSHDIKGALRAGIDSMFVLSGVHSAELGIEQGSDAWPAHDAVARVLQAHLPPDARPTHIITHLKW
ncbi:HAD-like domain-containing protein [Tribonema minus]|uniref:HAD-like domain-containing protein n=1 Tax=Tribonema minus TaxID=303371 RepID=A0A835Z8N2_9STRA|nr:HAD-like domain-containing protein [Tribonema minus]